MKTDLFEITGRIIDSKGNGVKNLIVVFYDTDKKLKIPKNLEKNVQDYLLDEGSERLGSTYSKEDGSFEFSYSYKDFAPDSEEERPDIIVVVLSPEEKEKDLRDGVLYVSSHPLLNGGQNEAILINISNKISRNIIPLSNSPEAKVLAMIKNMEANEKEEKLIKDKIAPKVAKKLNDQRVKKEKTKELFKKLSTLPQKLRDSDQFIRNDEPIKEADIKNNIDKGIELLHFEKPVYMPMVMTTKNLDDLGFDTDTTNPIDEIKIPYNKYCGLLNKKTKGKTLIRKRTLKEVLDEVLGEKDDEADENRQDDNQSTNGDPLFEITDANKTEFINNKVGELYQPMQNLVDNSVLHTNLKTRIAFDQDISPIDQKAFHDFHNLQIAFEDIWTELLDEKLSENIKSTYDELITVIEGYNDSGELTGELRETYDDLEKLLNNEKNSFSQIVSLLNEKSSLIGDGIPIPQKLIEIDKPDLNIDNWNLLSISQQNQIIGLLNITELDKFKKLSYEEKLSILFNKTKANYDAIIYQTNFIWRGGSDWQNGYSLTDVYRKSERGRGWEVQKGYFLDKVWNSRQYYNVETLTYDNPQFNFENNESNDFDQIRRNNFSLSHYFHKKVDGNTIKKILDNPKGVKSRVHKLISDINQRLLDPYAFHVFKKDTVNFGIMTTYRQEWVPSNWQVGDLVSTLPLAPGEKRKFTKKLKLKKTRSQKEVESSLSRHTDESSYITKAHSEIFKKVNTATNFNLNVEGSLGFDTGVYKGGIKTTTNYKNDQSTESSAKKKGIRESTKKAASEYKNERSIEIISKEESDFEESTSGEISNPNNEITVTYLFYELERQYIVTENLHKLTPVVLVAFDVPAPHEVDEDWLLSHEWILRRILLDDSFHEAFDYIREGLIGDEINFEAAQGHYDQQKKIVEELTANVSSLMSLRSRLQAKYNETTSAKNIVGFHERKKASAKSSSIFGAIFNPAQLFLSLPDMHEADQGLKGKYDAEYYEAERKALESRMNTIREELSSTEAELASENNALEKAKNQMMAFTAKITTKRNLINQLRIHVKQNILYYMQGVWEHEPPDQRFFRLYDVEATVPIPSQEITMSIPNGRSNPWDTRVSDYFGSAINTDGTPRVTFSKPSTTDKKKLHQLADIDNLIGFKGNYAIFPLKECTYITDFMMKDYVNEYLGIQDPDFDNEISTEDLIEIHTKIKDNPDHTETKERIAEIITARKANPVVKDETIVVPTGQLFIEALPGKHALLEDFKLKHRAMDVLKVQEEVREAQIENLRKSARILDKDYEDGDIDKFIRIDSAEAKNIDVQT